MTARLKCRLLAGVILLAAALLPAAAQERVTLSIRLVRAGQLGGIDPRLNDVAALMRGNMAFSSFQLVESKTVALPASAPLVFARHYTMILRGPAQDLDIAVTRGRSALLRTRVKLNSKAPLVLGGITTRNGTLMFVLNRL